MGVGKAARVGQLCHNDCFIGRFLCSLPGIPHGFYGGAVAHCAPAAERCRGIVLGQLGLNEWLGGAVGTGNAALAARRHKQQLDNIPFAAIDGGQPAQGVTVQNFTHCVLPLPQKNLVPGQLEQGLIEIVIAVGKVDVVLLAVVVGAAILQVAVVRLVPVGSIIQRVQHF